MSIKGHSADHKTARKRGLDQPRGSASSPQGAALAPPPYGIDFIDHGATRAGTLAQQPGRAALSGKLPLGDVVDVAVAGKASAGTPPAATVTGSQTGSAAPKLRARLRQVPVRGPVATGKVGYDNVAGPTGTTQGSFKWVVQWVLDAPSVKGGWVVQKVSTEFDVKDSTGKKVDVSTAGVDPAWWPMSEAWQVNAGQSVTTYAQGGDLEDDTYAMPTFGAGTKGTLRVKGLAQFHEGAALPGAFKVTNSAPAWILPYAKGSPAVDGGTGVINHSITAQWDDSAANPATRTFVA